jgi:hypothetical protein
MWTIRLHTAEVGGSRPSSPTTKPQVSGARITLRHICTTRVTGKVGDEPAHDFGCPVEHRLQALVRALDLGREEVPVAIEDN